MLDASDIVSELQSLLYEVKAQKATA